MTQYIVKTPAGYLVAERDELTKNVKQATKYDSMTMAILAAIIRYWTHYEIELVS